MSVAPIFLAVCIFTVAHVVTAIGDSKGGHRQSDIQVTRPTVLENTSVRSIQEDLRAVQLKLQSNHIEGSGIHDDKQSQQAQIQSQFHSQDLHGTSAPLGRDMSRDQSLFQSQRNALPATTISAVPSENEQFSELSYQQELNQDIQRTPEHQQFYNPNLQSVNQQQFYDEKQHTTNDQQFYNSRQQSPVHQQQLFSARKQSPSQQQQLYNAREQSPSQQQQLYNARQQSPGQQQQLFNTMQQSQEQQQFYNNLQKMDIEDQRINLDRQFQGVSVHQSQIRSDRPRILSQDTLTQIHSTGVRKNLQLSAFDNREHPLALPRSTSVHSATVLVSGMKNVPVLPAMVYNGGSVPSTHAIAYGRDGYYKGSASLRQHLQTPYVRYVYSHIL